MSGLRCWFFQAWRRTDVAWFMSAGLDNRWKSKNSEGDLSALRRVSWMELSTFMSTPSQQSQTSQFWLTRNDFTVSVTRMRASMAAEFVFLVEVESRLRMRAVKERRGRECRGVVMSRKRWLRWSAGEHRRPRTMACPRVFVLSPRLRVLLPHPPQLLAVLNFPFFVKPWSSHLCRSLTSATIRHDPQRSHPHRPFR